MAVKRIENIEDVSGLSKEGRDAGFDFRGTDDSKETGGVRKTTPDILRGGKPPEGVATEISETAKIAAGETDSKVNEATQRLVAELNLTDQVDQNLTKILDKKNVDYSDLTDFANQEMFGQKDEEEVI